MNTRDQFGNYLLLKKLAEDALGETFRAGRIGRQGVERVVLLRVLNGSGFDAERLARALQTRSGLAQALKSPNIGGAIDVGQVRGVPYVVYDYNAGRSLAQLMEQAARRHSPIPLDHALLVAERVGLALAVANETRIGDDRVQHGFVTPLLVQVSNEGELRLLGFEASSGLRESAAHPIVKQAVGRYLSPEALAGQPASRADDVYSLGAILLEMITGQNTPMPSPAGLGSTIDAAVVEADGTPIPGELAALLKRTLCPRDQRVGDAVAWHKSLAKLMQDGQYAATTFNLAFFLHNLFRDEIDREAREIESEKTQAAASMAATTAAAPRPAEPAPPMQAQAAASPVRSSGPVREDTNVLREEYGIPVAAKRGSNPAVMIAAGVGAVAVLAIGGYLLFGRGGKAAPGAAGPAPDAAAPAAAPAQTGMTPEQIQAMIQEALANQKKQSEGEQKASEEKVKALQKQLEDAQRTRAAASAPSAPPPSVAPSSSTLSRAAEPAPSPAAPAPSSPPPAAAATTQTASPATLPAPAPSMPVSAPQPIEAPVPAATRAGDLVTMGPGVTPPRVVRQPPLQYPPVAKRLRKEATVTVRVLIDETGHPVDIQEGGTKVGFGMDEAAQAYARNCQWEPAKKGGVAVKIWWELRVAFKL
jgi:TonB family protein